jgi:hypothetical protein
MIGALLRSWTVVGAAGAAHDSSDGDGNTELGAR